MFVFKRIWKLARVYRLLLFSGIIVLILNIALSLIPGFINRSIIDDVINAGEIELLPRLLLFLIVVTAFRSLFIYLERILLEKFSQKTLLDLKQKLFDHLQKMSFNFYNNHRTGELMSRMTGDMEAIRRVLIEGVIQFTQIIFYLILTSLILFRLNVQLTLISLISSPFISVLAYKLSKKIKPAFSEVREQFSVLNTTVQENITGIRVVKAFSRQGYELDKFSRENKGYYKKQYRVAQIWADYFPLLEFFGGLSTLFLLYFGGRLVINGEITMGIWMQFNSYLWMLVMPMRMAGHLINMVNVTIASGERIFNLLDQEIEIVSGENALKPEKVEGCVKLENVTVHFDEEQPILEDINLVARPGQTIAIMGTTGAGKTSLVNLLGRYYDPDQGKVSIDGIDVKELDLAWLRKRVGIVMQDVFLFSETIKENITYGSPDASFAEIKEAARAAGAHEFIEEMEDGYETVVGERGMGLSGGQKQRVSLARAILNKAPILVLDDATSAVDMETEREIQKSLAALPQKSTVFIIAHRISSVKDADEIIVLDEGRVIERGTHQELLEKQGEYYEIFVEQHKEVTEKKSRTMLGVK
ncbi:MAG: ABC transporter ATP-binding protein [Bacillota bacterium]